MCRCLSYEFAIFLSLGETLVVSRALFRSPEDWLECRLAMLLVIGALVNLATDVARVILSGMSAVFQFDYRVRDWATNPYLVLMFIFVTRFDASV